MTGTEGKINLLDMPYEELAEFVIKQGWPVFRTAQIRKWLYRGIADFDEMTNLPLSLRDTLREIAVPGTLRIMRRMQSGIDETCKYLFDLGDGNVIESVLMKYKYGYSVCISTQAGCRMGCTFCASAGARFIRDLCAGEMLGQIISINKDRDIRISHVVMMGIGEPLDNYKNTVRFLKEVQKEDGLGISYRKISLSTCGLIPEIEQLAEEGFPITLSVSLHSPFQTQREEMMPVARRYSLDKLLEACNSYCVRTGRRITFEYAMIANRNDSQNHALALADRIQKIPCHVNLIPVNPVEGRGYGRSSRKTTDEFMAILEKKGVSATVRRELGIDIQAACGQLRRNQIEESS